MADPKYANLPGIAHDQPDVFETSDLPESEQHLESGGGDPAGDAASDAVEVLHVSAGEALGRFRGKTVDARSVDFSDRISNARRKGYNVYWAPGEFEICAPGEEETPLQKYQRLNCEVRELAQTVQDAADAAEKAGKEGKAGSGDAGPASSLSNLAAKVSGLREELSSLRLEESLGAEAASRIKDPAGVSSAKLLAHLEELKGLPQQQRSAKPDKSGGGAASDSSNVTYELLMKPESGKLEEGERAARLERRLEALEKALGANPDVMSSLCVETSQKSLLGAVAALSARTALLEPAHLDQVEGRLQQVQSRLAGLAERRAQIQDQEKAAKVDELYDLVLRTHSVGRDVLPAVVDRLEALQGLHQQALNFSKSLSELETVQQKLTSSLANNETLLKDTHKKFAENVSSIEENFKNVEKRISQLQQTKK